MHEVSGLKDLIINPVLKSVTPQAAIATALYVVPDAPVDAQVFSLRASTAGSSDQFWVGFSTQANPTIAWFENGTNIGLNDCPDSQDVFAVPVWLPPTTTIWVKSGGGSVIFSVLAAEYGSTAGNFTGS